MKNRVCFLTFSLATLMTFQTVALYAQDAQADHGRPEPDLAGIHWAKGEKPEAPGNSGQAPGHGAKPSNPQLAYHGGPIMGTTTVTAIFWGTKWGNSSFVGDKITGLDSFYSGIGSSSFAHTSDEYYQNPNGIYTYVGDGITYTGGTGGHIIDTTAASVNGSRTAPILSEVCKVITNPVANGYYPVYVDGPRGSAGFCAWHSYGSCGGVPVQFGFFFDLDGDAGCDPQDTSNLHSQGLAALANVSGHEISEARSDPRLNAWLDSSGEENADKCAWSFGSSSVTFSNNSVWKIQGNWSNSAYGNAARGYANSSGQKGCIDGGNFN